VIEDCFLAKITYTARVRISLLLGVAAGVCAVYYSWGCGLLNGVALVRPCGEMVKLDSKGGCLRFYSVLDSVCGMRPIPECL
jgi:hypothetical protein